MAFLAPKPPKPVTPANPAVTPVQMPARGFNQSLDFGANPSSLISTSPQGLKRKATTQKISLIGG